MDFRVALGAVLESIFDMLGDFFVILFPRPRRRLFLVILVPNSLQNEVFLGAFLMTFWGHAKNVKI